VAFAARQKRTDPSQVHVRYLDSPVATQITRMNQYAVPLEWTSAGKIVFYTPQEPAGLWSVSPTGGEPEPLHPIPIGIADSTTVSPDGSAVVFLKRIEDKWSLAISSPPGSPPKPYLPAPFASAERVIRDQPRLKFSPDGKQILFVRNAGGEAGDLEAWLMPYPADVSNPPHKVPNAWNGAFSWMPDNRHVVVSDGPSRFATAGTSSSRNASAPAGWNAGAVTSG